jgi:hypothetical protein
MNNLSPNTGGAAAIAQQSITATHCAGRQSSKTQAQKNGKGTLFGFLTAVSVADCCESCTGGSNCGAAAQLLPPWAAVVGQGVGGGAFHSFSRCNVDRFVSPNSVFSIRHFVPSCANYCPARRAHTACSNILEFHFFCFTSSGSAALNTNAGAAAKGPAPVGSVRAVPIFVYSCPLGVSEPACLVETASESGA